MNRIELQATVNILVKIQKHDQDLKFQLQVVLVFLCCWLHLFYMSLKAIYIACMFNIGFLSLET